MTGNFEDRLDEVERALKVIKTIENNPDLQSRAFEHLFGAATVDPKRDRAGDTVAKNTSGDNDGQPVKPRAATKRTGKASSVSVDKSLDTSPNGVQSWKDFAEEKSPSVQNDRNTVAVYWLKEIAQHDKVNASKILTLYIDANWKPASDPKNSLQVTASATGFIDTSDMEDIKVSPRGLGRVRNDLPATPSKK